MLFYVPHHGDSIFRVFPKGKKVTFFVVVVAIYAGRHCTHVYHIVNYKIIMYC